MKNLKQLNELWLRIQLDPRVHKITSNPYFKKIFNVGTFARLCISFYFLNEAFSSVLYWYYSWIRGFPILSILLAPFVIPIIFNYHVNYFGIALVLFSFIDSWEIFSTQYYRLINGWGLFINELMVKKLSMLGASLILISYDIFQRDKVKPTIVGLLLTEEPKTQLTNKRSLILLLIRVLLSSLFLYVGYLEIERTLTTEIMHEGHLHRRKIIEGDGHNNVWPKFAEFTLAVPIVIGLKTKLACRILAICLIIEAFMYWSWWISSLGVGYMIHSRQHFAVNIAVAGATFQDGKLLPGEVYTENVYQTVSYKVSRLPYGILFLGSSTLPNPGQGLMLISHTNCPGGGSCSQNSKQYLVTLGQLTNQISDFKNVVPTFEILSLNEIPSYTYGWSLRGTDFPFRNASMDTNIGYIVTGLNVNPTKRKFLKVNFGTGEVLSLYPSGDTQLPYISNGDFNTSTGLAFLLDYAYSQVIQISLSDLSIQTISFANYFENYIATRLIYDPIRASLFVFGDFVDKGESWGIRQFSSIDDSLVGNFSLGYLFTDYYSPLNFFKSHEGVLFIIAGSNKTNDISSLLVRTYFISQHEVVSDVVTFSAGNYTGHFFTSKYLYIVTSRGHLVKINCKEFFSVEGIMTIVTQSQDRNIYNPGIMPILQAPLLYTDDIVFIGCDWWGLIVTVDLNQFCPDTQNCDEQITFSIGGIVAVVVIGSLLFLGSLIGLGYFIYRRRAPHRFSYRSINHQFVYGTLE